MKSKSKKLALLTKSAIIQTELNPNDHKEEKWEDLSD
jgi:hypothetical protein